MAFTLVWDKFFVSHFHDAVIGRVLETWDEFGIEEKVRLQEEGG